MKKFPFNFSVDHTPKGGKRLGLCNAALVDESDSNELKLCDGIYRLYGHSKSHRAFEVSN